MRNLKNTSIGRKALGGAASVLAACVVSLGVAQTAGAAGLNVWDDYTFEGQSATIEQLNKAFEAAHPGATVTRTARTFDDMKLTLKLAVSAGNGPMVTKVNQGAGDMGTMVKEGLLLPVDAYITKYGWDKLQSDSIIARDRWSDKGQFGEGPTYGISSLGEMVGLFYNKKVLDDAGLPVPKNFDEFTDDLDKLKAKGIAPFMVGTSKQHMALHMIATVSQAHIDAGKRSTLDDLIYGRGGTWKTEGNVAAATLIQKWATGGYFYQGFQGISGDDAVQLFVAGQGAFLISGTWYFGDMQNNPDIHFMPFPAPHGVSKPLTVGGVDLAWSITSLAKDKATQDLAGEYINYMISPEAALAWAKAGYLPSTTLPDNADYKASPLLKEGIAMWKSVNADNALGHYPDWAAPTLLKTIDDATPHLLAGDMKPEAFIGAIDADYQAYLASKKK